MGNKKEMISETVKTDTGKETVVMNGHTKQGAKHPEGVSSPMDAMFELWKEDKAARGSVDGYLDGLDEAEPAVPSEPIEPSRIMELLEKEEPKKSADKRTECVKAFLRQKDYWDNEVEKTKTALEFYLTKKYSPGSPRLSHTPRSGRKTSMDDKLGIIGVQDRLVRRIREAQQHSNEASYDIMEAIAGIESPEIAETIRLAYIDHKSSSEIGKIMGVSGRQVRRRKVRGYELLELPERWEYCIGL